MGVITIENIQIITDFTVRNIMELSLRICEGKHGRCVLKGILENGEEEAARIKGGEEINVKIVEKRDRESFRPVFQGIAEQMKIDTAGGVYIIRMELTTASKRLDEVRKSRSFQDISISYKNTVKKILDGYGDTAALCHGAAGQPLGTPALQYRETDWEFLLRLAKRLHFPVFPVYTMGLPAFRFGMRDGFDQGRMKEYSYMGISHKYYKTGWQSGMGKKKFLYYSVETGENYEIGDYLWTDMGKCVVFEKEMRLTEGELRFHYLIGMEGCWYTMGEEEGLVGLELRGKVMDTKREEVFLQLDIDGEQGTADYAWKWMPEVGNLMYCMPEKGTEVRLCLGDGALKDGRAESAARKNENVNLEQQKREFETKAGKKMELHPEKMSVSGNGTDVQLIDGAGIDMGSGKNIEMMAAGNIRFKGKRIRGMAAQEINMYNI